MGQLRGLPSGSLVKNLPAVQETQVWSLSWKDPLWEGMATNSSIFAWRIPRTEEPGGLESIGSQRVRKTEWLSSSSRTVEMRWNPKCLVAAVNKLHQLPRSFLPNRVIKTFPLNNSIFYFILHPIVVILKPLNHIYSKYILAKGKGNNFICLPWTCHNAAMLKCICIHGWNLQ